MPKLSHFGVLICGIALCVIGVLAILLRPDEPPRANNPRVETREPSAADLPSSPQEIKAAGEALVALKKCNFCHRQEPDVTPEHPRADCQHCHRQQNPPIHYHLAPPLSSLGARRPSAWLRRFLRYPYAVRVHSPSRMPDMGLGDFEVEVLARYIEQFAGVDLAALSKGGPRREAQLDADKLARARTLASRYTCTLCHSVGEQRAAWLDDPQALIANPGAIFAPNLGTTFNRVRPGWLKGAILRPSHVMPWAGMPDNAAMTEEEAELLAWWVMNCAPSPKPMKVRDGSVEVTLGYAQVQEIFNLRCLSCHYGPRPDPPMTADPQGGAGWLGTWGKPRKLSLESYAQVMEGALDDLGRRRAVVVPFAENSPMLMHLKGLKQPQMPYGRDMLPEHELRIIESWILSGAAGPEVKDGVTVQPPLEFEGK